MLRLWNSSARGLLSAKAESYLGKVARYAYRRPLPVLALTLLLVSGASYEVGRIRLETDLIDLLPESSEDVQNLSRLRDRSATSSGLPWSMTSSSSGETRSLLQPHVTQRQSQSGGLTTVLSARLIATLLSALCLMLNPIAWYFRRLSAVVLVLAPLLVAGVVTFGAAHLVIGRIHLLPAVAAALLLSLGIGHGMHLLSRYQTGLADTIQDEDAVSNAFAAQSRSAVLVTLTLLTGCAALSGSAFIEFRQFGTIAALGVALTSASYLLVLPALLRLTPGFRRTSSQSFSFNEYGRLMGKHAPAIFFVSLLGCVLASSQSGSVDSRFFNLKAASALGLSQLCMLLLLLGNFGKALTVLVPSVLTLSTTLGVMKVFGLELDGPGVVLLPMLFGLTLVSAAMQAVEGEARHIVTPGRSMVATVFIIGLGIGTVLLTNLPAFESLWKLALLGLLVHLFVSLVVLPSLLHLMNMLKVHHQKLRPGATHRSLAVEGATVGGAGLTSKGPGTVGTVAALLFVPVFAYLPFWARLLWVLALLPVAWFATRAYLLGHEGDDLDPGEVVIDEFVGMWLTLLFVPLTWMWTVLAFVLFRAFDIVKPGPVGFLDRRVKGALGVNLDDLAAGFLAGLILLAVQILLAF
jgi:phosphatidylglycerophosphatase A